MGRVLFVFWHIHFWELKRQHWSNNPPFQRYFICDQRSSWEFCTSHYRFYRNRRANRGTNNTVGPPPLGATGSFNMSTASLMSSYGGRNTLPPISRYLSKAHIYHRLPNSSLTISGMSSGPSGFDYGSAPPTPAPGTPANNELSMFSKFDFYNRFPYFLFCSTLSHPHFFNVIQLWMLLLGLKLPRVCMADLLI